MGIADIKNIHLFEGTGGPGKEKEDKIVVPAGTGGMKYEDWLKGDEYDALAKRYSEAGRKVADDTMGIAAARTGGLASSYAVSAGAQAYGGYMERLEDAARALYESERNSDQWERQFAYSKERDQIEDQRLGRDDAREQILTLIQSGKLEDADIPDELLTASGWDPLTVEAYKSYYSNANQRAVDDQSLILDFDADEIVEQLDGGNVNPSTLATYRKLYGRSYADVMIENETFKELSEEQLEKRVNELHDAGDDDGADALYDAWYGYLYELAKSLGLSAEDLLAQMKADKE